MGMIPWVEDWALDGKVSELCPMFLLIKPLDSAGRLELLFGYDMFEPVVTRQHVANIVQPLQQP